YPGGVSVNVSDVAGSTQGPQERASKLSSTMQLVLEIERARQTQPQTARLARAVEVPLADLLPVDRKCRSNVIQVAVSVQALGTALFLLLDHLFSRAAAGDALNIGLKIAPVWGTRAGCTRKHFPRPRRWLGRNLNGTHSRIRNSGLRL